MDYQFKGNFVRAEIFYLIDTKILRIKEAWCLLLIDNLIHVYKQDAFISNEALAEKLQTKPQMVTNIISKLKKLGLLEQTKFDGRKRFLRVNWEVAKVVLNSEDYKKINSQPIKKLIGSLLKNLYPGDPTIYIMNNKKNNTNSACKKTACAAGRDSFETLSQNFLKATCIAHKKLPSIKTWATQLKRFLGHEELELPRVKKVLLWYCKQFDKEKNPYHQKYLPMYVPQANSMQGFCRKFYDIEMAMQRNIGVAKDTAPVFNELSKSEQVYTSRMKNELQGILSVDNKTISALVINLNSFLQKTQKKIDNGAAGLPEPVKNLFHKSLFNPRIFFTGYAMWIREQITKWDILSMSWKGNMNIFNAEGNHFKRYMEEVAKGKNISIENVRRVFNA